MSVSAWFVADIRSRHEPPCRFVKAALLVVGKILKTILGKARSLKRLVEKRIGKVGGKWGKAGGAIHGKRLRGLRRLRELELAREWKRRGRDGRAAFAVLQVRLTW